MARLFCSLFAFISLMCCEASANDGARITPIRNGKLQMGFLRDGFLYTVQRGGFALSDVKVVHVYHRLYKLPVNPMKTQNDKPVCFEMSGGEAIINPSSFLRWRISPQKSYWGVCTGLDDAKTEVFYIPVRLMKPLPITKIFVGASSKDVPGFWSPWNRSLDGSEIIEKIALMYWHTKGKRLSSLWPRFPTRPEHPKGSNGIYFDFVPKIDESWIRLFILFEKDVFDCSIDRHENKYGGGPFWIKDNPFQPKNNIIEMWDCPIASFLVQNLKDGEYDGSYDLPMWHRQRREDLKVVKIGMISTNMRDAFYVFDHRNNYYFLTTSGKIYFVERPPAFDPKSISRLIAGLNDENFKARESASRKLIAFGRPAEKLLEDHLSKPHSAEQKRRLEHIIDRIKNYPISETKLLWNDEKRPVDRLLFDMDHRKIYAFTKPDANKRRYVFEIQDKPRPRLLTLPKASKAPASLPDSAKFFFDFACSLQKEK